MKSSGLIFIHVFVLSTIMLVQAVCAQETGSLEYIFFKGNTYYEDGDYVKAIKEYTQLREQGLESGNLYFNLGNSYFKTGELGRAIVNYERAKRLNPRDSDLKSNYQFARSKIKYNVTEELPLLKRAFHPFHMFTINESTIILSFFLVSAFLFPAVGMFTQKGTRYISIVVAILIIFSVPFAISLYSKITALDKEAIVLSEEVEARFEPFDSATTHFTLYEGMKINILDLKREWIKVRRQDGKTGWIREQGAEKV